MPKKKKHVCTIGIGSFCPVCGHQVKGSVGYCEECDTIPEYTIEAYKKGREISLCIPDALVEAYCNI